MFACLISNDGKNEKNIKARRDKGQSIVDQIMSILESTVFGPFQFEVALILRASLLLNGILTNSEAWYGLKTADLENLEQIDEQLLRRILEVGSGCPKEMLYLETGSIPIRFIITYRRLMFLHYILTEDPDCLIYRFYSAQRKNPSRNDWSVTVENDIEDLGISQTIDEIKSMKKEKFGKMLKKSIEEKTLKYLNKIKLKHTKVLHIVHNSLCLQEYLKPENVKSVNLSKFLFQSRTRMLEVKTNFRNDTKNEDMSCPLNCKDEDDQKHLLECDQIDANCIIGEDVPKYEDLFGNNVVKQMKIAPMLQSRLQKRKKRIASRQK
jgi:hypothetical protein